MRPDRTALNQNRAGRGATLLGFASASAWALLVAVAYCVNLVGAAAHVSVLMAFSAAALGPIVLILFSAWAARDAAKANARIGRVAMLAEDALAPSTEALEETRDLAAALRAEVEALDGIVHVAAKRLTAFENGLRQDGGVLARGLAEDVAALGRVRRELDAETVAVGEAIARHVAALHETAAQAAHQSRASTAALGNQLSLFDDAFAHIGKRSAEFAAAAAQSSVAAGALDAAVEKALGALAHATSLTDTARRSAEEAASVAHEAAGAVRGATRSAVAEARDAAKQIRAEAAGAPAFSRFLGGGPKQNNLVPPASAQPTPAQSAQADVIEMTRPAREPARGKIKSAAVRDLASIVAESGVSVAAVLSAEALDDIAQAARGGAEARREAVRVAAPSALRRISSYLRRNAGARRDAEELRREPRRALGAANESEHRRRDLAGAYLLIDAVLG